MKTKFWLGVEMTELECSQLSYWVNKYFYDFAPLNTLYKNQVVFVINKWLEMKRGEKFYSPIDTAKIIYDQIPAWDGIEYKTEQ